MSFNDTLQALVCDHVATVEPIPAEIGAPAPTVDPIVQRCGKAVPGRDFNGFRAERNARTTALEHGWQIAVQGNNQDFCPVHSTENAT